MKVGSGILLIVKYLRRHKCKYLPSDLLGTGVSLTIDEIPSGLVVSKFGTQSEAVTSVWVQHPPVAMLRTCSNMTLTAERAIKPNVNGEKVLK